MPYPMICWEFELYPSAYNIMVRHVKRSGLNQESVINFWTRACKKGVQGNAIKSKISSVSEVFSSKNRKICLVSTLRNKAWKIGFPWWGFVCKICNNNES